MRMAQLDQLVDPFCNFEWGYGYGLWDDRLFVDASASVGRWVGACLEGNCNAHMPYEGVRGWVGISDKY